MVTLADGSKLYNTFIVGEGLCSDQTHILNFGLGGQHATSVTVSYLNGKIVTREGSFMNQLLSI